MGASNYVTQRQVAEKAGVHQTTVSLVFRNHPSVPAETRRHVLEIARKMGYRRHPLLAVLMSTRLRVTREPRGVPLAFLTDFEGREDWKNSATAVEMFGGARSRARELGYRLEVFWLGDPRVRPTRLGEILRVRGIHGLLLAPTPQPRGLSAFDFAPFASVGLGVNIETAGLLSVAHGHFNGMGLALRKCLAAGRRRIAVMLSTTANELVRNKWFGAYALACDREPEMARLPAWEVPFEASQVRRWLDKHRPDALVGTFDARLRPLLKEIGCTVPKDIALVSLSVEAKERYYAGIYQRSAVIGARAVDLLIGALNRNEQGLLEMRQVLEIEGEWREGESLPSRAE